MTTFTHYRSRNNSGTFIQKREIKEIKEGSEDPENSTKSVSRFNDQSE